MRIGIRGVLSLLAVVVAVPLTVDADSTLASVRSETQLQLGDLLFEDQRFWESMSAYELAKKNAKPDQVMRASVGMLRSLLQAAEFHRAHQEALFLRELQPTDPKVLALYADGLWSAGLFEEAEATYREILDDDPSSAGAHHGLGRSLAAKNDLERALMEVQASLTLETPPEYHHTLGAIYRRQGRYPEAAEALDRYVAGIDTGNRSEKAEWARSEARFLRSFGSDVPLDIDAVDQVHTIPFRLVNDKIVVRGRINGQALTDLVVDTGAEQMVLSKETAQKFGVRPIVNSLSAGVGEVGFRALELGRVNSLEVATLAVRNLPALIRNPPLKGLPTRRVPDSFSPLAFGLSAIIDYRNHRLTLARNVPAEPADFELPMRVHRLALVRGVVNEEHQKSFVVDTGGEVISISLATADVLNMRPVRRIPLLVYGTSGWDQDAFLLPGVNLAFNQILYENFSVVVLNLHRPSALLGFHIGGIIGHNFLSNYRVTLDLERSLLRLATN